MHTNTQYTEAQLGLFCRINSNNYILALEPKNPEDRFLEKDIKYHSSQALKALTLLKYTPKIDKATNNKSILIEFDKRQLYPIDPKTIKADNVDLQNLINVILELLLTNQDKTDDHKKANTHQIQSQTNIPEKHKNPTNTSPINQNTIADIAPDSKTGSSLPVKLNLTANTHQIQSNIFTQSNAGLKHAEDVTPRFKDDSLTVNGKLGDQTTKEGDQNVKSADGVKVKVDKGTATKPNGNSCCQIF